MEIERKFLIRREDLPPGYETFPCRQIEQGYLCTNPVVRIRRSDEDYILTYKGSGLLAREEYNLPLNKEAYHHLRQKTDGILIIKKRYLIPQENDLVIELDVFDEPYQGLILAEVEFKEEEEARRYQPPSWFYKEVTYDSAYQNSTLSKAKESDSRKEGEEERNP